MNEAALKCSINESEKLLKKINLLKERNNRKYFDISPRKFSTEFISVSQEKNYTNIYETAIRYGDYDFLLNDDSIVQFSCEVHATNQNFNKYRYAFFENPRSYPTYEEFLKDEFNSSIEEVGESLKQEYEQIISEAELSDAVCPVRYDYDYKLYKGIYHPISHIHIGHNNNVRIGIDKILTPEKFIVFILMNVYPAIWEEVCKNDVDIKEKCLKYKSRCEVISSYINDEEDNLLLLR